MRLKRKKDIQHKRITVGDIAIAYLIKEAEIAVEDAPTVVFIHGFPFNKNMWIAQLAALPNHVTGIAIDVRGHGTSTIGHGFFSVDLFAGDLLEFFRKMEIERAIVCGVSMGGYIALRAHEMAPEKFTGLLLSDTNSISDDNDAKTKRFETIRAVLRHGNRPFALSFVQKVFAPQSLESNPQAVELIKSSIRRNNVRAICATLLALASRRDTSAHLAAIEVPTLLIWGAEDHVTPLAQAHQLMKELPKADLVVIPNCGHLPNLEDTKAFNQALLNFIETVRHAS